MVGDIHIAKIYFTDHTDYKLRPILIFKEYSENDLLFLPLTTNKEIGGFSIESNDLKEGHLKKKSVIIFPKIGIIHKSLLTKKIGRLKQKIFKNIMAKICNDLECKKYF